MDISRKRKPIWVREIIQEAEKYGDPKVLKYCNFKEYSICIFLWSPMVLLGEPLVLLCTPMLLIERTNKSHEVVPSNCKGGSLTPRVVT